ncbi:MAG: chemotaxis protein CheW [Gemmataceae bacterium]
MINAESYVLFELAATSYAIPSQLVQRLELIEHITPVPNAPSFIDGVVFSRGIVVPALNLRKRFGFEFRPYDSKSRLIVVSQDSRTVGLVVDSAREFVTIRSDTIQPTPESLAATSGKYVSGVAHVNDKIVLVLDIKEVLESASGLAPSLTTIDHTHG